MNSVPVWLAALISVATSLIVALVSKWYDHRMEYGLQSRRRLEEAELAVTVEKAKASQSAEGYLWTRIEKLEAANDQLRRENSELGVKLNKALDDHEEESRKAAALALRVDELNNKIGDCREENMKLVRRIVTLEGGKKEVM